MRISHVSAETAFHVNLWRPPPPQSHWYIAVCATVVPQCTGLHAFHWVQNRFVSRCMRQLIHNAARCCPSVYSMAIHCSTYHICSNIDNRLCLALRWTRPMTLESMVRDHPSSSADLVYLAEYYRHSSDNLCGSRCISTKETCIKCRTFHPDRHQWQYEHPDHHHSDSPSHFAYFPCKFVQDSCFVPSARRRDREWL